MQIANVWGLGLKKGSVTVYEEENLRLGMGVIASNLGIWEVNQELKASPCYISDLRPT